MLQKLKEICPVKDKIQQSHLVLYKRIKPSFLTFICHTVKVRAEQSGGQLSRVTYCFSLVFECHILICVEALFSVIMLLFLLWELWLDMLSQKCVWMDWILALEWIWLTVTPLSHASHECSLYDPFQTTELRNVAVRLSLTTHWWESLTLDFWALIWSPDGKGPVF